MGDFGYKHLTGLAWLFSLIAIAGTCLVFTISILVKGAIAKSKAKKTELPVETVEE